VVEEISQELKSLCSEEDSLKGNIEALENLIDYLIYEMYFEEFDKELLEAVKAEKEGEIDSRGDIQRLKESSSIKQKMKSMNELEEVRIVEQGKSRENHWLD